MKKIVLLSLLYLYGCNKTHPESLPKKANPLDIISFHQGYLEQQRLTFYGEPCNLEQVIAGMKTCSEGKPSPYSEEEVRTAYAQLETELSAQQKIENLRIAERFLRELVKEAGVLEVIPQKLYYKILKSDPSAEIVQTDLIGVSYRAIVLDKLSKEHEIFAQNDVEISIPDTIVGFAKGLVDVRVGERRKLFIHPDLAYGAYGGKLEPNQLLIIDLEINRKT